MRTSSAGESALLLLDAVDVLAKNNIPYAVIGALAAAIHGAVRASMDVDIIVSLTLQAADLEKAFAAAGFSTQLAPGDPDDPIPGYLRVSDQHGNCVDVLLGLKGMDPSAFSRTMEVPFQGQQLRFIGREDFIAMKVFAGGPVDLADASRAIVAGGRSLDTELARRVAQGYGTDVARTLEQLLAETGM